MFSVFRWFGFVLQCDDFIVIVLSDEPKQNQVRGLVDREVVKASPHPVILLLGVQTQVTKLRFVNVLKT